MAEDSDETNILAFRRPTTPEEPKQDEEDSSGPLNSSSIQWTRYDAHCRELYVCFRDSRETYVYSDVAEETYELFMASESKGRFLNQVIKPHHEFEKLG